MSRKLGYLIGLGAAAFFIPANVKLSTLSIGLLAVVWLFSNTMVEKKSNLQSHFRKLTVFLFYYLILVIGLLMNEDWHDGARDLEKNSALFILPLILLTGPVISEKEQSRILLAFVFGCLFVLLVDIGGAFLYFKKTGDTDAFFYHNLSEEHGPFHVNPIYLSVHFIIGFMICASLLKKNIYKRRYIIAFIFKMILLLTGIFLLSSKTAFAIFTLYVLYELILGIRQFSPKVFFYTLASSVCLILVLSFFFGAKLKKRYMEIYSFENFEILNQNRMNDFSKMNGLTTRLMFWKFGLSEMHGKEKLLGQGTSDVQPYLNKVYEQHNMAITLDGKQIGYYDYNAHNQYIESYLKNGVLGLLAILSLYLYSLVMAVKLKNSLFFGFCCVIMMISFTESIMEANKGIVLFGFFSPLFLKQ